MTARISTMLETTPDRAWAAVQRPETFLHVVRGALGIRPVGPVPAEFGEGAAVAVKMRFFHVLPAPWVHTIRLARVDHARRELLSNERGGPIRKWNHRIAVEEAGPGRCRYTDEVEIDAGTLTPLVWLFAHGLYRYRQMRWRRLARRLGA